MKKLGNFHIPQAHSNETLVMIALVEWITRVFQKNESFKAPTQIDFMVFRLNNFSCRQQLGKFVIIYAS